MYGLNRYRSFLRAPKCECGCGQPAYLVLKTDKDVGEFCCAMLFKHECPDSAIFAVYNDGRYQAFIKDWNEEKGKFRVTCVQSKDRDPHIFAKLDGEFRFCCYNLIIEEKPEQWIIQS